eukprot:scaffold1401_cov330-Pavlova_lutheri.AAC.39
MSRLSGGTIQNRWDGAHLPHLDIDLRIEHIDAFGTTIIDTFKDPSDQRSLHRSSAAIGRTTQA